MILCVMFGWLFSVLSSIVWDLLVFFIFSVWFDIICRLKFFGWILYLCILLLCNLLMSVVVLSDILFILFLLYMMSMCCVLRCCIMCIWMLMRLVWNMFISWFGVLVGLVSGLRMLKIVCMLSLWCMVVMFFIVG